jgi:arylsulfatase A-like enzyme
MNIVLIISDTFRHDHLGCYGNPWIRTPHLDRLAERAIVFDRFYATSFPTMPNRADLLVGKYSFTSVGWAPLPREELTLPQLLSQGDYSTAAVVDTPFYIRNGYGYDRGFGDFIWNRGQRSGAEHDDVTQAWHCEADRFGPSTLSAAEMWLERHYKEKFFLLVDTWDPHEPWDAPDHYAEMYHKDYDGRPSVYPCYWEWQEAGLSKEDVDAAHAHYCAEITMVDRGVGRLLERIESLGLMEETAIIFTSDHGFYFGEHGQFGKGRLKSDVGYMVGPLHSGRWSVGAHWFRDPRTERTEIGIAHWYRSPLYEEVTRIPLLMYLPQTEPGRIDALAGSLDLMPTILELAGLEIPEAVQAPSLIPLIQGERDQLHNFIITSWPLYNPGRPIRVVDDFERRVIEPLPSTITDGEWTLLYATEGEAVELYHTPSDPKQDQNIFEDNQGVARDLHAHFVEFLESVGTDETLVAPRRRPW